MRSEVAESIHTQGLPISLNPSVHRVFLFHCSKFLEQPVATNTTKQGDGSLGAYSSESVQEKHFKTSPVLFCPAGLLRFPSFHIKHGGRQGCILLKVHSWAQNRTPASCLSAHFWTMLPQEGTFENSNSLPLATKLCASTWSMNEAGSVTQHWAESRPEPWLAENTQFKEDFETRVLPARSSKAFRTFSFLPAKPSALCGIMLSITAKVTTVLVFCGLFQLAVRGSKPVEWQSVK